MDQSRYPERFSGQQIVVTQIGYIKLITIDGKVSKQNGCFQSSLYLNDRYRDRNRNQKSQKINSNLKINPSSLNPVFRQKLSCAINQKLDEIFQSFYL